MERAKKREKVAGGNYGAEKRFTKDRRFSDYPDMTATEAKHLQQRIAEWRERDLKIALALMASLVPDGRMREFWSLYDRHSVLNPAPSCCVAEFPQSVATS